MKFKFNETRNNKIVSFSSVLPSVISRFDIGEQYLIASLQAVWHEIVGDLVATHSIPVKLYNGICVVLVDHPVYANELSMMKNLILEYIGVKLSSASVRDIKIKVSKIEWNKNKSSTKDTRR